MSIQPRPRPTPSTSDGRTPAQPAPATDTVAPGLPRTRAGTTWVLACVAAVAAVAFIVFIAQNVRPVEVSFLGWQGDFPLAVTLLAAALTGTVLALVLGSTRILQLRHTAKERRRGRTR